MSCGNNFKGKTGVTMSIKINTAIFIDRANKIHKNEYDYSQSIYTKATDKVKIICKIHGAFYQTPDSHMRSGCPLCGVDKRSPHNRSTLDNFSMRANEVHGNLYDYSKVMYKNSKTKVCIVCKVHGDFYQTPTAHLGGQGCPMCSGNTLQTTELFIERASKVHNNLYNYSKTSYVNANTKVEIVCPKHGSFYQTPYSHLQGQGCNACSKRPTVSTEDFVKKAMLVHKSKYDYSLVDYKNAHIKVKIICPVHGIFEQTPDNHTPSKQGCPKCKSSRGEKRIANFLDKEHIYYLKEFRFSDCRYKKPLPFDFAIFEDKEKTKLKCLTEFDGIQHYRTVRSYKTSDGDLELRKKKDRIKTEYCLSNNIKLIRIPYWDFENIEEILHKNLYRAS